MPFKHKISLAEHDKHHLTQNLWEYLFGLWIYLRVSICVQ